MFKTASESTIKINREKLFYELYESSFPAVARFVRKMNGNFDDAKDIFQEALVVYYEKSSIEGFVISASHEAYILGIAKHLWIRKFRKDQHVVTFSVSESEIVIPDTHNTTMNEERLLHLLEETGKKCLDLLVSFYHDNKSIKEIMNFLGYRNEHTATVQKYKCLERVRDTVKEKQLTYEDFFE
ncbi:RNA polymerase sigma factor [Chryseosolibacter indicus]|uniref:RNA polymerase sigma-70 region 2 domain-containing protein n=1 Tax=Chryseosolibacter indicus TaxID=2782351 RepID=A0ABS5VXF8_9BACT|nr:sigma factor [Chryseosolibacter indicus]MBT1705532.1 hypothetical protein [Chryseosolibacter indicus]